MADFILAPNPRWQGRDQTGQPIQGGKLYTYLNQTTDFKPTYQDYLGVQPNTNPVILDGKGEANIYWAINELYTIKLFTADDQEVDTQDNYPVVDDTAAPIVNANSLNVARNPQFNFWYFGNSFPVQGLGSQTDSDYICDDWLYNRDSSSYTVNISQEPFPLDQTDVPNNPSYFFRYAASTTPTGESDNRLYQRYVYIRTFADQKVSVSLYAKSPTSSTINVYLQQYFGTGGSPSTPENILIGSFDLSTNWELKTGTVTLPDLGGKTLGTAGGDALILKINFPNDAIATIDLCDVQVEQGPLTAFSCDVLDSQFKQLNTRVSEALPSTGDAKSTIKDTPDDGWLLCDDTTLGNTNSGSANVGFSMKALYNLIWNNVSDDYAPIYTSVGALTTRGATANDDFNALKRLSLTKTLGRVIASAGTAVLSQTFTADAGTDLLTLTNAGNAFYTAVPVVLTTTGTLPAPLALATTYYCVLISGTTIKLGTTAANAINGTVINITDAGTGTHTITINYSAWVPGQFYGEKNHGLVIAEMPAHDHPGSTAPRGQNHSAPLADNILTNDVQNGTVPLPIASQGGSGVMNIMQPTAFMNFMIKL